MEDWTAIGSQCGNWRGIIIVSGAKYAVKYYLTAIRSQKTYLMPSEKVALHLVLTLAHFFNGEHVKNMSLA